MARHPTAAFTLAALLSYATVMATAPDPNDTLLLDQPDIGERDVTFVYDNDVWIASREGGQARRLTSAAGAEAAPHLSPDGSLVAFSGNYDGNVDVYVVPATGSVPKRLTWHGGADMVQGFLPNGRVLFSSYRDLYTDRMIQLYSVSIEGGMPQRLPVPDGDDAQVSPDGSQIAYSTMPPAYKNALPQQKNYRGGDASRIWIMNLDGFQVQEIPQPAGRSNDLNPVWLDDQIYFLSDRAGEFNLFCFDARTSQVSQLSDYRDFPVMNLNGGGGRLVYERAGALYVFDPVDKVASRLRIGVGAELLETRPRYLSDPDYVRAAVPSPDASQIAIEYRGEIVTVPAAGGAFHNLTRSTGANDRSPSWAPDGKSIAWFSDLSGEYALYVRALDSSAAPRRIDVRGAGFYEDLKWSPDGRFLSFRDNSLTLYIVEARSGALQRIAQEPIYTPSAAPRHSWSPDSHWLAYSINDHGMVQTVYLYSMTQRRSFRVTGALVDAGDPVFDPAGDYLYVAGSIDAGPVRDWFTQSRFGQTITRTLYAIPLRTDTRAADSSVSHAGTIDLDGMAERAVAFPATTGAIRNVQAVRSREVFYQAGTSGSPANLLRLSVDVAAPDGAKPQSLLEGVSDYRVADDGSSVLYRSGSAWRVVALSAKVDPAAARPLAVDAISVRVEPRAEWHQIVREGWRIQRDNFYASNHHGADWDKVWQKYEPFLAHAVTRSDVARIQSWISSELAVSHGYVFPGEVLDKPPQVSVGLLGADYAVAAGRYRFAKIYRSNWTPDLVAPLAMPGARVAEGEFLLAVESMEVHAADNLYEHFQNTAGRAITLTVGSRADGTAARQITAVPTADDTMLRRIDWIESNIRKVDTATNGRVAYVHAPDTAGRGMALFKRYFYPQSHKEAIIVDARFNGGGSSGDYYIDLLRRAYVGEFATRYGEDQRVPRGAVLGPKVLIVNKMTRSGGDLLAYAFRKLALGPIVGTTTTGALVGNLGVPELLDGSVVTAPNFGLWSREDGWTVENRGVSADIEVQQWPAAVNAGHDPQ
ncbi:MAG: S41 family peptidase, partial [Steroidobacteraceae bacterium]